MDEKNKVRVTKGEEKDNEEYVDFINYVFGFNGKERSFYKLLPKLFGEGKNPASTTYFVKDEKDRMLSCVGTFPLPMSICKKSVNAVGFGNVAVHPRERGKGYMIKAMYAALDDMVSQGCDLVILSGKRTRYDHFGFEKCGNDAVYALSAKTMHDRDPDFCPRLEMKPLTRDDSVSLDGIKELHDRVRKYRFVRDRDRLYDILVSWQSVPYVFYMGDRFAGWALVKENRTVTEIVIDPGLSCFKDAVYLLMRGRSGLDFTVPEHDKDTCDALFEYAETVYVGADLCFNVLNYEKMLSLLLELKSTYESLADGELTLQINGFAGKETLKITVEKGIPRVEKTSEHPELVLEHLDALRLFFMHKAPARSTLSPVPRSWLPLPIYVYSADNA